MLHTIGEIKKKLESPEFQKCTFVKISVDSDFKGIQPVGDLVRFLREKFPGTRKDDYHITDVVLSGRIVEIKKGIDLFPASPEELFEESDTSSMNKLEEDIAVKNWVEKAKQAVKEPEKSELDEMGERLSQALIRNGGRVVDSKKTRDSIPLPSPIRQKPPKVSSRQGLFARIKAWLKGDKGYRR